MFNFTINFINCLAITLVMKKDSLTRTFGHFAAIALAASPLYFSEKAQADAIPQPYITSITNVMEVSTNLVGIARTNDVYRITATNAVPGHSYSIESRQNLAEGDNLENQWYRRDVVQARQDGTLLFKIANKNLPQEYFRIQTLDTNTPVETISYDLKREEDYAID